MTNVLDFDSYADWWEYQFDAVWTDAQRAAWYAKWRALGIPADEIEPRRDVARPLRGTELLDELSALRDHGLAAWEALSALGRDSQATERLAVRYRRHDLERWLRSERVRLAHGADDQWDALRKTA